MRVIVWQELVWPYIGGIELVHQADLRYQTRVREVVVATRQGSPDLPCEVENHGIPIHRYPLA
jgi:hypothetical protein